MSRVIKPESDWTPDAVEGIQRANEAWLERHREELAGERKPTFRTSSGLPVKTVYTPSDLPKGSTYERDLGFPGEAPFTRGQSATGYRGELWSWEFYAGFGSAKEANKRYRYLLEQGSTGGVSMALDLPTQIGMDSDHPLAKREIGRVGVAINTLQDVLDIFDGIPLKKAGKIFTTGNAIGPIACAWFYALAAEKGESPHDVQVTIQNDPLKEYVARGTQFLPVRASVELAADVIEFCAREGLPWFPISVSGSHMKQAGGTCAQEAAFTLANALAYAEAVHRRGLPVEQFAPRMELHFCTDMDFFEEIAKYRVIRRLWSELLKERFGVDGVKPHIHAATSGLPLTAQQPKNNIVRITLQALAQVLGGVAQTRTASYDEALAIPTEDAVKVSIRTNQIIAFETGIPDTVDPLGGSYYLESLTLSIYEQVRGILDKVDAMGGAINAVESGWFQRELADGAYRQQQELETKERIQVGVNEFVDEEPAAMKIFRLDVEAAANQRERIAGHKATRDQAKVAEAIEGIRADLAAGVNGVPGLIRAVRAGVTLGEIADLWRAHYGEYRPEASWLA